MLLKYLQVEGGRAGQVSEWLQGGAGGGQGLMLRGPMWRGGASHYPRGLLGPE